ncbi:hypothetical protein DICPUDRAFT_83134 [Dictyostelium purpureum]|uniref:Rab GTPase n=1 Tax=Dictyostelium purpureum TaxID=5786 RepID=F0ZYM6_DICPU|nr:uncharacterized protein DICPUDRAFT_83134 [Dictyostelium purpureum]EGC30946.1 hypothetical protein DICPUDRAFT_83134 [Dictyostelium purpureum]|eukprot:XP_003292523.1 hypothetical protein DICPUDRAFT_83134 [Dictyostelium purpureum]
MNNKNNSIYLEKPKYLYTILMRGDNGAGKTQVLNRYVDGDFGDTSGYVDFKVKNLIINEEYIKLRIWDLSIGCESFRRSQAYFRNIHGIVFIYDIINIESFTSIKQHWYEHYKKFRLDNKDVPSSKSSLNPGYGLKNNIPQILVIGTKSDLRNKDNYKKCVDTDQAREFANSINALFYETSSKDNINVNSSFLDLTTQLINCTETIEVSNNNDQKTQQKKPFSICSIN